MRKYLNQRLPRTSALLCCLLVPPLRGLNTYYYAITQRFAPLRAPAPGYGCLVLSRSSRNSFIAPLAGLNVLLDAGHTPTLCASTPRRCAPFGRLRWASYCFALPRSSRNSFIAPLAGLNVLLNAGHNPTLCASTPQRFAPLRAFEPLPLALEACHTFRPWQEERSLGSIKCTPPLLQD